MTGSVYGGQALTRFGTLSIRRQTTALNMIWQGDMVELMNSASGRLMPLVALMTDFQDQDGFVGVMKGLIYGQCRQCMVVDVAHHLPKHGVHHAGWVLSQVFKAFPAGTVLVCVVDPHVGSGAQQPMALVFEAQEKIILLPNNGLCSRLLNEETLTASSFGVLLEAQRVSPQLSHTFHGRDVYAPLAGQLAQAWIDGGFEALKSLVLSKGCRLELTPTALQQGAVVCFPRRHPQRIDDETVQGDIETIDGFGNVLTNLPHHWFAHWGASGANVSDGQAVMLDLIIHDMGLQQRVTLCQTYESLSSSSVPLGLIPASHGCMELACFKASAAQHLGINSVSFPISVTLVAR